jgi:predicted nucleotidyltransferase
MISRKTIGKAVELLARSACPKKIILFGSYARGDATEDSDLDFLIIKSEVRSRRAETVGLLRVLEPHEIPADILVASEAFYEAWKDVPGTVVFEAAREGEVVYEAA